MKIDNVSHLSAIESEKRMIKIILGIVEGSCLLHVGMPSILDIVGDLIIFAYRSMIAFYLVMYCRSTLVPKPDKAQWTKIYFRFPPKCTITKKNAPSPNRGIAS